MVVVAGSEDGREVVVKVVGGLVEVVRSRISFRAYPMLMNVCLLLSIGSYRHC